MHRVRRQWPASARIKRLAAGGIVAVLVIAAATSGGSERPATGERTTAGTAEPTLDARAPRAALRAGRAQAPSSGGAGNVVEVLPPGNRAAAQAEAETDGEALPARILRENRRLRREVDHLRALEAEQRRVSLALAGGTAFFDAPLRLGPDGLGWPVSGPVVSPFGQRWGRLHAGVDIAAPAGTVIRAAQGGGVAIAAPTGGYGNYVCVQHTTELSTCYAHLSRYLTRQGALVRQGQPIGLVGCTGQCYGDHVHFETRVNGQPVDPLAYLGR